PRQRCRGEFGVGLVAQHRRGSADASRGAQAARAAEEEALARQLLLAGRAGWPRRWRRGGAAIFGPWVTRVAATQLAAQLRVRTPPEAGQVLCDLDSAAVGR